MRSIYEEEDGGGRALLLTINDSSQLDQMNYEFIHGIEMYLKNLSSNMSDD